MKKKRSRMEASIILRYYHQYISSLPSRFGHPDYSIEKVQRGPVWYWAKCGLDPKVLKKLLCIVQDELDHQPTVRSADFNSAGVPRILDVVGKIVNPHTNHSVCGYYDATVRVSAVIRLAEKLKANHPDLLGKDCRIDDAQMHVLRIAASFPLNREGDVDEAAFVELVNKVRREKIGRYGRGRGGARGNLSRSRSGSTIRE